jgi:thiol-disulfide isomerase/thioredoxin
VKSSTLSERVSGIITFMLILASVGVVGRSIFNVANGPLPLGPGGRAPPIRASYINGGEFDLQSYRGQIVILDFWATWCGPCVRAMPALQRIADDHGPSGVSVVGVNQEPSRVPHVRKFLRSQQLSFPNIIDPGTIARAYGVMSFPTTVIVDHEGVIRVVHRGAVNSSRLEQDIKRLLKLKNQVSL